MDFIEEVIGVAFIPLVIVVILLFLKILYVVTA